MNMIAYQCIACSATEPAGFDGFVCCKCGGNLDILYDYEALAGQPGSHFPGPGDDLFRYSALLPLNQPAPDIPLRAGGTPLHVATRLGRLCDIPKLYLKDETTNPSASLKDRASAVAIARALETGAQVVSLASTGNAGSSLACLAAACGLQAVVFVPADAPVAKLTQMLAFGAHVLAVRGNYDDAYDLCLSASREFGWFNRSTGHNPFTREGKKTCSYEIWQDLGRRAPDRVVVSAGDGNIISAIWKGWLDLHALDLVDRLPKIDCVQSEASAAINRTIDDLRQSGAPVTDWQSVSLQEVEATTVADSISVNRPRDGLAAVKAVMQSGGEAVTLSDKDILAAIPEMARYSGVFAEPAAAATWAAVRQMATNSQIADGEQVVCVVSGNGLKDISSAQGVVGQPMLIEPTLEAVRAFQQN